MVHIYKRVKNEPRSGLKLKRVKNKGIKKVLRFKRIKNEATMIFMCKWVKNDDAIQDFKV